jgi:tRNA (cmo5U34)-methyltransferase
MVQPLDNTNSSLIDPDISISKKECFNDDDDDRMESTKTTLGPSQESLDGRYPLVLLGNVDQIYRQPSSFPISPFEFNQEVVSVFDDMVSRSVPLYFQVIDLAIYWLHKYYQSGTNIYDLGCSTGTTLEVFIRSFKEKTMNGSIDALHVIGVDNSPAMIQACKEKLAPYKQDYCISTENDSYPTKSLGPSHITIDLFCQDILTFPIEKASFVIMNYTLQFIPVAQRLNLLQSIYTGLETDGILFLSEKVRAESPEVQETCTYIYEDFKRRNHYTNKEIERKKEALMNVLIPYTEQELRHVLIMAGFQSSNIEIVAKWNNFTTLIARKSKTMYPSTAPVDSSSHTALSLTLSSMNLTTNKSTPHLDRLVFQSFYPNYLSVLMTPENLRALCKQRLEAFHQKGNLSTQTLATYDDIASSILSIPPIKSKKLIVNSPVLCIGEAEELTSEQNMIWYDCACQLKPWKKGPLNLFGLEIDTEWRSDLKWARIQPHLPSLKDKVVCDLGCGNGYFMYRMLEYKPKMVIGIDPNLHALIEFNIFQRFSGVDNLFFEFLRADCLALFSNIFDVVFCLGVLYHTQDPIGMLQNIWHAMKSGGVSNSFISTTITSGHRKHIIDPFSSRRY